MVLRSALRVQTVAATSNTRPQTGEQSSGNLAGSEIKIGFVGLIIDFNGFQA
jgi:hypothetical protein